MRSQIKLMLLDFFFSNKKIGIDLSGHRVYTTRYEDMCM